MNGYGSYSLSENPGHLRFRSAVPTGPQPYMALVRKFRGDHWVFETKVSYFTGRTGGGRGFSLGIGFGGPLRGGAPDRYVAIYRYRDSWNDCCPGNITATLSEKGGGIDEPLSPTADDSYVWRITRSGRVVTVELSDDGIKFTQIATHTFGPQIEGVIQYVTTTYATHANNDAYADYDYVRLSKGRSEESSPARREP